MSDSDSGPEFVECEDVTCGAKLIYEKDSPFVALQPPEVIYERLNKIPTSVRKQAAQLMNVNAFWYHIMLLRQESHKTTHWGVQVGFIDANVSIDLSLKRLSRIEILEAILRAMEKGCFVENQTRHMIWISNKFNLHSPEVLDDAYHWLEKTREPLIRQKLEQLGHKGIVYTTLQHVFTEYAHYIQAMGFNWKKLMKELAAPPSDWAIEKCEEMKSKGNDQFQKKKYDAAVKFYTKALKLYPENHIVYGNRALCNIRCEKYLKAVGDGKRAMLIQPSWAKGHYRFCEALYGLGEHKQALEANAFAQTICADDPEGMKDLQQQYAKFSSEMEEKKWQASAASSNKTPVKASIKRHNSATRSSKTDFELQTTTSTDILASLIKTPDVKSDGLADSRNTKDTAEVDSVTRSTEIKSEKADMNKTKPVPLTNKKTRKKDEWSNEKMVAERSKDKLRESLQALVLDAHTALSDQRSRNAEQAFSLALSLLETSTPKELGISSLDIVLLIYGRASSLTEIGQPEELVEALGEYEKIKTYEQRKFQCLVSYGIGKVYLKWNRFSKALGQFYDSLQMIKNQITPGKLTWPTTKETIRETQPGYLKELVHTAIEMCRFHPKPDAICRYINCHGHSKVEIYFTDPDFKGFIQIICCHSCSIEYHISCWKTIKASSFSDRNEKDFIQEMCFTPDCGGRICCIKIYDSTGIIKCKFKADVIKSIVPVKLREKQKCTNLRKIKAKEDRKLRRQQRRQEAFQKGEVQNDQDVLEMEKSPEAQSTHNATSPEWLLYGDRVLIQMSASRVLFEEERSLDVSILVGTLCPWIELDRLKGNAVSMRLMSRQLQLTSLAQVAELLLERKNRVWARILVNFLSGGGGGGLDASSKLHDWAHQLDNTGLSAAQTFIERHAEHLEELDLAPLLAFGPFQDVLIESFGVMPEAFFRPAGLSVTEYLKQAAPQQVRLFIWTLEEHRDLGQGAFASYHSALDEYFEMMDGLCLVIKKPEYEFDNNSPNRSKNRNRKKKHKDSKSIVTLSGIRRGMRREEDVRDFMDEADSLTLLDPTDPFAVPDHLRNRVAEFEGWYVSAVPDLQYKAILDNTLEGAKESLLIYFAHMLESYGPLEFDDPLLVAELANFAPVDRDPIKEAGGLKPFLLDSPRFVLIGQRVGLASQSSAQGVSDGSSLDSLDLVGAFDCDGGLPELDPLASEFLPVTRDADHLRGGRPSPLPTADVYTTLPCPYVYGAPPGLPGCPILLPSPFKDHGAESPVPNSTHIGTCEASSHPTDDTAITGLSLGDGAGEERVVSGVTVPSATHPPDKIKANAAVQVSWLLSRSVAVNTEPCESFERNNGDLTKREKSNMEFEKQIRQIGVDYSAVVLKRNKSIAALNEELEHLNHSIQVTNEELVLLQQKLEEEVQKDQQEKKENQDTLKALKTEMKELTVSRERLTQSIVDKANEYKKHINDFSELRKQSAAEKMSMEDEIKRCTDLCVKANRRTQAAQLATLESCQVRDLRGLKMFLSDGQAMLTKLEELAPRYHPQILYHFLEMWKACVKEVQDKISTIENQYRQQMGQIRKGVQLASLSPVTVPSIPKTPPTPPLHMLPPPPAQFLPFQHPLHFRPPPPRPSFGVSEILRDPTHTGPEVPTQSPVSFQLTGRKATPPPSSSSSSGVAGAPAGAIAVRQKAPALKPVPPRQNHQSHATAAPRPSTPKNDTVFERILDRLSILFPHHEKAVLVKLIQEVRVSNGGALNSLCYEDVINQVAQVILDEQDNGSEQMNSAGAFRVQSPLSGASQRSDSPASARSSGTPPPGHAWKSVGPHKRPKSKALNMEDPCIICHEDMCQEDLCVLECRHSFHGECIRYWLREQSTCPTCREHALLPEDFPMLTGRMRRGHRPSPLP